MNRLLLLLLSLHLFAVSLLPGSDAHELTQVAEAWQQHARGHADGSLRDFVYDHFVAAEGHGHADDHAADHQSLPLHHGHEVGCNPLCLAPAPVLADLPGLFFPNELDARPRSVVPAAPQGVARACWQPPRA